MEVPVPSSNSSVRGLSRDVRVELRPDESCEHMMRRLDRAEVAAICRHLVGGLVGELVGPTAQVGR